MKRTTIVFMLGLIAVFLMFATSPPAQATTNHLNKVTITAPAEDNNFTANIDRAGMTASSAATADQQTLNDYSFTDQSRSSPGILAGNDFAIGNKLKNADGLATTASEFYYLTVSDTVRLSQTNDAEYLEGMASGRFSGAAAQRHI